jgi:polyhydroxybutyrate depolymerase
MIHPFFLSEKMTKTHNLFEVLSVLLLTLLACTSTGISTPTTSSSLPASEITRTSVSAATTSPSLPAGEITRTLTYAERERSYILYVPASINWSQPVPLVFVFHGGTGNAESAIRMSGFNEVADQNGFIVVYPNGTGRLSDDKLLTWNGGTCCGYAQEKNVDDVGFVRAVVADLQPLANIDAKRIYATGMSNGGLLSNRLACEAADIFAAVAPVAGTLNFLPCTPSQPISVIEFHGTDDQHIPYNGGAGPESLVDVEFASVQDSVGFWILSNGCNPQPQTNSFSDIQHEIWTGCTGITTIELYTIIGGGHSWPGGTSGRPDADQPTQTISASQLIWEFFAAHPKP